MTILLTVLLILAITGIVASIHSLTDDPIPTIAPRSHAMDTFGPIDN